MNWDELDAGKASDEAGAVAALLAAPPLAPADQAAVRAGAEALVLATRKAAKRQGLVETFLREFSLGAPEGLALMCLAEALLRTPDDKTRDRLIAEKIGSADWAAHLGRSPSLFVNASTWSLMLTGRLVDVDEQARTDLGGFLKRLAARAGEPVIRQAVGAAIGIMGEQFVLGQTIEQALKRAKAENQICSFDMLGEGARSAADAGRHEAAYARAIGVIGAEAGGAGPERGHGVSVKLSALSPRYEAVQAARVWDELYPRLKRLAVAAAGHDLNFTLDAEEADRLVLSLALLERLCREPDLAGWRGLGLAVQAYQKRAPAVIKALDRLARETDRRLMVRLVKGAYWDSEIKRAQVAGRRDYPVYTTKSATDLSYLACAKAMIGAAPRLFSQFATHNAHSLTAVRHMAAQAGVTVEFQRLHGMGEALYAAAAAETHGAAVVRTYAPVGGHEDLLPYLVRRLLENGANTSFVHSLLDERTPPSAVIVDPIEAVKARPGPHPKIPRPAGLYGDERVNSLGVDLSVRAEREALGAAIAALDGQTLSAGPIVGGEQAGEAETAVKSPADRARIVGQARDASAAEIDEAFRLARLAQPAWDALGGEARAKALRAMGDALENETPRLVALLCREAGKTLADAVSEVREAADFCRYYAHLAQVQFGPPTVLKGPAGETNSLGLSGRGVFACISPWNFPLAIFTGQIAAALAAGNAVLAKPAEQTPLIAAATVRLFHASGLDPRLLALLPGPGDKVGAALIAHPGLDGVAFTGGTDTAWAINRALAARKGPIVPFIAETGGLNAMVVDTTALREQVIDDVVVSAFGSAGQRCSALRILFAPRQTADALIEGIAGAMDALVLGDPALPSTDVGPVIDEAALGVLTRHLGRLEREATIVRQLSAPDGGVFFGPVLAEIPDAGFLEREVFGPILHVVRYDPERLDEAVAPLVARGYGLTLGVHSRLERFAQTVMAAIPAGNVYVNRSIIGAVVGVQPFGGHGLSGTGPKAGGPHALSRFGQERSVSINIAALGGDPALLNLD
jgi:RHH-type proline utilization regulon transcriptional repressor/proline dehydrogenase/delta 1-pyrroline-5-carboxylate dehydrogenase